MRFRSFDNLRVFDVVARLQSITVAADELCLSKGAISYQIRRLEEELGFPLFIREHGGIRLTDKGKILWHVSQASFERVEQEISELREDKNLGITVGMSTYFASRWLSPRLMRFMEQYPKISLRLQPMIDLLNLRSDNIDMAIRWGKGDWTDMAVEPLFICPAIPTAGRKVAHHVEAVGLEKALDHLWLLNDRGGSVAWSDWFAAAGLYYRDPLDNLVIPDPNVRVQALIDGQGIALNDALVNQEIESGQLFTVSDVALTEYGYFLAYPFGALANPALRAFRDWIIEEAGCVVAQ